MTAAPRSPKPRSSRARDIPAQGGEHSVENVRLRCRPHNRHEADRDYGELFMALKRGERGERGGLRETPAM